MPKRKSGDDYDHIKRKIKRLEKELRNHHRSRSRSRHHGRRHRRYRSPSVAESDYSSRSYESRRSATSQEQQDENYYYEVENDDVNLEESRSNSELETGLTPNRTKTDDPVFVPSVVVVPSKDIQPTPPASSEPAPATSDAPTPSDLPVAQSTAPETEDLNLDSELLDILGTEPSSDKKYGKDIHKDLPVRFQHWSTMGLPKDSRKELKEKYLTPQNCQLIDPPELNAEIKAAVSDIVVKRDKAIENKQKHLTSAITSLGEAITHVLSSKEKDTTLLKLLMDSARMICDCQHADTQTRRNFLLNSVKREMREQLQNTKVDKLLFGVNLADTLKSAKAIHKSGTDLKSTTPKLQSKKQIMNTPTSSKNLNWKNPGQVRRLTGPPRMKEPAMTSTRSRPPGSSKQSHLQQRPSHKRP